MINQILTVAIAKENTFLSSANFSVIEL